MKAFDIKNPLFLQAIAAVDTGSTDELMNLIDKHPWLVRDRLDNHKDGYFKNPYLLWYVADNPIRAGKLPDNIVELTRQFVQAVKRHALETYQYQIDYTLGLVASGNVPHKCGVQIAMLDLLIDSGASPDSAMNALTHGNIEAAQHLVARGDKLTLALAVCLERNGDINNLVALASTSEKIIALVAAAYYGKAGMIKYLLQMNTDPNGFPEANGGFHSHATALHQAVNSGCLDCVKLLVGAGARLDVPDKIYNGTPLGWADYLSRDSNDETRKRHFSLIQDYLYSVE